MILKLSFLNTLIKGEVSGMDEPRFRLDPEIEKFMQENDCNEMEAANILEYSLHEIFDVIDDEEE